MANAATWAVCLAGLVVVPATAAAQEMEPKAYSASPVGATFLVAVGSRSTGGVVIDPTLPVDDVDAGINSFTLGAGTTFGLFGKLALVSAVVPYAWGDANGNIAANAESVTQAGIADIRAKLSVNLIGNPAMRTREFAAVPRRTIVGTSLTMVVPSGEYEPGAVVNLGSNRWAFRPEVGISVPRGRWDIDAYVGVWLFAPNGDFYPGGLTRSQDPIVALQAHASYTFKPRLWLAVDGTWYAGGDSQVDDREPVGGVKNSRLGATLSVPAGRQQSFKISYSSGLAVRTGSDFTAISVGWQWLWFRE